MSHASGEVASTVGLLAALAAQSVKVAAALGEEVIAGYRKAIPAGRLGSVDDVAATVAFLAGDHAGYISGAVVPVDGGLGMGH